MTSSIPLLICLQISGMNIPSISSSVKPTSSAPFTRKSHGEFDEVQQQGKELCLDPHYSRNVCLFCGEEAGRKVIEYEVGESDGASSFTHRPTKDRIK